MNTYKNVDEYIQKADKETQPLVKEVRMLVQKAAPKAVESIAYGMPAYTFNGKPLFYFALMKGHLGLYPTPGPIETHKDKLKIFQPQKDVCVCRTVNCFLTK